LTYVHYAGQNVDKIKFITFTDVHLSSVNPCSRKGSYERDIFEKLEQIKKIGEKLEVNFFICAGDLFNLKAPMRNPHALNSRIINLFKSFPAPIYATEGNHDLRQDSYETFDEQPLNVIYSSDALIQARNIRKTINNITFRIRSIPFQEEPDLSTVEHAGDDVDLSIFILHLYATLEGGMLFKTKLFSYYDIAKLMDDVFVMGHYHIDQGIEILTENDKPQHFINVGALSRGSLSEEDTNRHPKAALITITKTDGKISIESDSLLLKVKSAAEVFDLVVHEREKKEQKEAQEFVAKLQMDMIDTPEEDRISDEVNKMDLDKKVLDKVNYFLNEAHLQGKSLE
jgi:DNA repair exonuclease SbcCD nuclease subunit